MRARLLLAFLCVISLSFAANSQQQPAAQSPASSTPAEATPHADSSTDSTIIFFRERHYVGSGLKPSIYLDGKELDRLENGRWFSVHAAPGKHELQSSAKNQPATLIETKPGGTTYVQMVIVSGNWRGGGRLMEVDSADAQKVIAKLKPLHE
ncbi:MAG TPA: hypothetical protein VJN93_09320 [Candidatus Acidoferrum sp.]|nr:hypothetical protein [Candidatus Acidoferrum sp.]